MMGLKPLSSFKIYITWLSRLLFRSCFSSHLKNYKKNTHFYFLTFNVKWGMLGIDLYDVKYSFLCLTPILGFVSCLKYDVIQNNNHDRASWLQFTRCNNVKLQNLYNKVYFEKFIWTIIKILNWKMPGMYNFKFTPLLKWLSFMSFNIPL